jgi:RNA 3'-terminal phosphate cyclase (ATP)
MAGWVEVDGGAGEGGGQILRSSLALSKVTGRPFRIHGIRRSRPKPGLARQHLMAVEAAAQLSGAAVQGAALGSTELSFEPGPCRAGRYRFAIGTAGSMPLLLQALYLPLALLDEPSELSLAGGSHVPWSPTFDYLERCWAPLLARMGVDVELELIRAGFYPPGGGELRARIHGKARPTGVNWCGTIAPDQAEGISWQANLTPEVAERQARAAEETLGGMGLPCRVEAGELTAHSRGTAIALWARGAETVLCATALGERGKCAEEVGREAARILGEWIRAGAPLDPHAADQMLLPLSLAREPSSFLCSAVTAHLTTQAGLIPQFLPVRIEVETDSRGRGQVRIEPA